MPATKLNTDTLELGLMPVFRPLSEIATRVGDRIRLYFYKSEVAEIRPITTTVFLSERDWELVTSDEEEDEDIPESLIAAAQAYRESVTYSHGLTRQPID